MWIKNTNGRPDAMLTFSAFSFLVVTLNVFLSTFDTISVGDVTIMFKALDSSIMAVYLGSTFTAYVSRRWTDKKYESSSGNPLVEVAKSVAQEVLPQVFSEQLPPDVALSQIELSEDDTATTKKRKTKKESV
jgi:hypothetical protein